MIRFYCDMCGREIDNQHVISKTHPWIVANEGHYEDKTEGVEIEVQCTYEGRHICRRCAAELLKAALEKEKGAAEESAKIARKEFPMGYIGPIPKDGPEPPARRDLGDLDERYQNTAEWEAFMDAARRAWEKWEVDAKGGNNENRNGSAN